MIGSGKSTLLEHLAIEYINKGCGLLDLYGSADGEALAWLRSDAIEDRRVLLLKGDNVDIASSFDAKTG